MTCIRPLNYLITWRWLALFAVLIGCGNAVGGSGGSPAITAGSACSSEGKMSCGVSAGASAVLGCNGGVWEATQLCATGMSCAVKATGPVCGAANVLTDATSSTDDGAVIGAKPDASVDVPPSVCKKPAECDDGDPCTTDACNPVSLFCTHLTIPTCGKTLSPCAGSVDCAASQVCDKASHTCVGCIENGDCGVGKRCIEKQCFTSLACQSDVQCKSVGGVCDLAAGVCVPCLKDGDCGEAQLCKGQSCETKLKCSSSKDCPAVCDETAGLCAKCLKSADCATGLYCTGEKTCRPVVCKAPACAGVGALWSCAGDGSGYFIAEPCEDGNPCTADACSKDAGAGPQCVHTPFADGTGCDDANACTIGNELCTGGDCGGGTPKNCDDANQCTTDTCDSKTGVCAHVKLADNSGCDDGDLCTLVDSCHVGACEAGAAKVCAGVEVCVVGGCKAPPAPDGMVLIPAGSFNMGCVAGDTAPYKGEKPQHPVMLDAFYLDIYEVTVAKYKICVDAGKCSAPLTGQKYNWAIVGKEQHPVNGVTWAQSDAYCKWTDVKGHLPSEAQWEKGARGGLDGKIYPWGDSLDCDHALFDYLPPPNGQWEVGCDGASTMAVGSKPLGKNGYGLYDMAGNVSEWAADWYGADYYGVSATANPSGAASGTSRVFRGGSFSDLIKNHLRASWRGFLGPSLTDEPYRLGLRCSRSFP